MGFRYQKRIRLGKGFGFNLSKSGISSSLRTKKGTLGSKGVSLKTGISGLTFRKTFSKSSKSGCFCLVLMVITISISIFISI